MYIYAAVLYCKEYCNEKKFYNGRDLCKENISLEVYTNLCSSGQRTRNVCSKAFCHTIVGKSLLLSLYQPYKQCIKRRIYVKQKYENEGFKLDDNEIVSRKLSESRTNRR